MPPVRRWGLNYHNFVLFKKRIIFGGNATILSTVVMWDQLVPTTATRYTCSDSLRFRHIFFATDALFGMRNRFLVLICKRKRAWCVVTASLDEDAILVSLTHGSIYLQEARGYRSEDTNKRRSTNVFILAWWNKYQREFLFDMEGAKALKLPIFAMLVYTVKGILWYIGWSKFRCSVLSNLCHLWFRYLLQ